jgi:hypothetical protein
MARAYGHEYSVYKYRAYKYRAMRDDHGPL